MEHLDALGRTIDLPRPPQRIVSLVPSLTELLHDLGLDAEVVGVTRFCVRPPGWKDVKARVGGTKQVKREAVAALGPDLILANKEENTREDVEALAEVAPVYVTDVATVDEALTMIGAVGALVGRADRGTALAAEIEAGFAACPVFEPRRAVYLIWRRPWMTVGADTFIHDVMQRGGYLNAFGERERYPELDDETLAAVEPEVVLLSSEPFPFSEKHLAEVAAVVPEASLHLVDGELFSWYGSRLLHTPDYLRRLRS